ncbi:MAG: tol-pal system protein YbgF [Alphaproteobacteria bacterium]|nr:tol-pal system protein YbgF [Alphaproteobacteria bacterium]
MNTRFFSFCYACFFPSFLSLWRDLSLLCLIIPASMIWGSVASAQDIFTLVDPVSTRLNEVEMQLRDMTGKVEEHSFRLDQLQSRIGTRSDFKRKVEADPLERVDFYSLWEEGEDKVLSSGEGSRGSLLPVRSVSVDVMPSVSSVRFSGEGEGNIVNDLFSDPGDGRFIPYSYEEVYTFILQGNYVEAQKALRSFMDTYPDDERAFRAHYWLGQSYFLQGNFRDAADIFLKIYQNDTNDERRTHSLLRLAISFARLDETEAACSGFSMLKRAYPHASSRIRSQAIQEAVRVGC